MSTIRKFARYLDGYYGSPVRISRTPREYPFAALGDITTAMYNATYLVDQAAFAPTARGTVDPENAGFYLVAESKPEIAQGDLATFVRTYASLPGTQTDTSRSQMVNLPTIPAATTYALWRDSALVRAGAGLLYSNTHFCDYSSQTKYGVYGPIQTATIAVTVPTSGTFAFTYKANTTAALNWNDSGGTIATAINALASIVTDGITVNVPNVWASGALQVNATVGTFLAAPSVNVASLAPASMHTLDQGLTSATSFLAQPWPSISTTAHGLTNTGQALMARCTPSAIVLNIVPTAKWLVYDANTLQVGNGGLPTLTGFDAIAPYLRDYTPGSRPVPASVVTRFSLTALTPDTYQGEGDTFLQAIFSSSTAINYRVGDSARWPNEQSPIVSLATTKISAADL